MPGPARVRHILIACCGVWKCSCQACPACITAALPPVPGRRDRSD